MGTGALLSSRRNQRNVRSNLQIDHECQHAIELTNSSGTLSAEHFFEYREVLYTQLRLGRIGIAPALSQAESQRVVHGFLIGGIFCQQAVMNVISLLLIQRILIVNGPELRGLGISHLNVSGDDL